MRVDYRLRCARRARSVKSDQWFEPGFSESFKVRVVTIDTSEQFVETRAIDYFEWAILQNACDSGSMGCRGGK